MCKMALPSHSALLLSSNYSTKGKPNTPLVQCRLDSESRVATQRKPRQGNLNERYNAMNETRGRAQSLSENKNGEPAKVIDMQERVKEQVSRIT